MALIIDGYNLLHVTGISGRGPGLQGSRNALLRFLAATISPGERPQTTIVFDAAEAPPGLPRTVMHDDMTVRYASNYDDADALIEELIAENHVPRSLLVVSSDHRIQRAARRRRAKFVDSDEWFANALRQRERSRRAAPRATAGRAGALGSDEIAYWLTEFGAIADAPDGPRADAREDVPDDLRNPFPPGYGEDLLDEA